MDIQLSSSTFLPLSDIEPNEGQIEGLPKNPRFIRDEKFEALKRSIAENPEMLSFREILVYPYNGKYIVIGGNMRITALKELGFGEVPCKILPTDTSIEQLKAYTIKDNNGYGEWDWPSLIEDDWDLDKLQDWGLDNDYLVKEEFDSIPDITDEIAAPSNEKLKKISIQFDKQSEDMMPEVKSAISELIKSYEGVNLV